MGGLYILFVLLIVVLDISLGIAPDNDTFPKDFKFGVATAAYQIEGAWNINGKTDSMWDYYAHTFPEKVIDGSNADIGCDSYNKVDVDIQNLKDLNVDFYRFSISWPRLLPTGFSNEINNDGVRYYNEIIDKLIANGIEPVVTIYHWDLPKIFHDLGGWTNPKIADYFAEYSRVCFSLFGDRVKTWITINEPFQICNFGYGSSVFPPFYNYSGIADYLCGHTVLLAHANAYRIYDDEFREHQKGKFGISVESFWFEPATQSEEDITAAENAIQMHFGWFTNAIYSMEGDYPAKMRQRIDELSKSQGFYKSRLPHFTAEQVKHIKGTYDFLGLNHYTTVLTKPGNQTGLSNFADTGVHIFQPEDWDNTGRDVFKVVPWGLRKLLNWIKSTYNNPEVIITENGYGGLSNETIYDIERVNFYNGYLSETLKAINLDGCNVSAYTAWSFMDNYEWTDGYTMRFGLYHVDFEDPERTRTPKLSAYAYNNIITTRKIDENLNYDALIFKKYLQNIFPVQ